ncbi:MAG: VOC family protein [Candidatus Dormibacteria bacterium]
MANPIVHFEITGKDGKALQDFYQRAFGWEIDANNPMAYGRVSTGGSLAGGIGGVPEGHHWVTVYVEVPDLQAALDQIERLGGKTLMPITEVPGGPTMAQFQDPEGNMVGLLKA